MADEKVAKIKVASSLPNAVRLQVFEPGIDDGTGHRYMVPTGPGVVIAGTMTPGVTVEGGEAITENVDADFFAAWSKQNTTSLLCGSLRERRPLPEGRSAEPALT